MRKLKITEICQVAAGLGETTFPDLQKINEIQSNFNHYNPNNPALVWDFPSLVKKEYQAKIDYYTNFLKNIGKP